MPQKALLRVGVYLNDTGMADEVVPLPELRYTLKEACQNMPTAGHFGPWDESAGSAVMEPSSGLRL
jgi:hypothetical protein